MKATNPYLQRWKEIERVETQPRRARNLIEMEYAEFEAKGLEMGSDHVKHIVDSLYAGDVYLLRNALPKKFLTDLRNWVYENWMTTPSTFHKIFDGCPNFHRLIDAELAKNYAFKSIRRSSYFFRWNQNPLNLYEVIDRPWGLFKLLGGFDRDAFVANRPKDGIVDRAQVACYPSGAGLSELHSDPYLNQRIIISAYMSKRGEDYQSGGFNVIGPDGGRMDCEERIEIGDIGICYATVQHEVALVDPGTKVDWDANTGRWWLGLYSIDSDEVKNRHTGHAVKPAEVAGR